jgi:hypothetical protein
MSNPKASLFEEERAALVFLRTEGPFGTAGYTEYGGGTVRTGAAQRTSRCLPTRGLLASGNQVKAGASNVPRGLVAWPRRGEREGRGERHVRITVKTIRSSDEDSDTLP